jgi:hypothetical protein
MFERLEGIEDVKGVLPTQDCFWYRESIRNHHIRFAEP